MNAISKYLEKQEFSSSIAAPPSERLKAIVVIPSRAEPYLERTILSLEQAARGLEHLIEIIIVINDHDQDNDEIIKQNIVTTNSLKIRANTLSIHTLSLSKIPFKKAGVGFARKQGMDQAIYRFNRICQYNGIICSMDADTIVAENYFTEVFKAFNNGSTDCVVIHYEHLLDELLPNHKKAIVFYELHLRYYIAALKWAGFPHAHQTLGSAIAVSSTAYAAQGGMPTRQAGEDFYFVHKFSKLNRVYELNTTTVYPSARISDRVPFGTGKAVGDMISNKVEWGITYPFEAFKDLRMFLFSLELLYHLHWKDISLPLSIRSFLEELKFDSLLLEIKSNTCNRESFHKRFFQKMDAFWMMKYIHFARDHFYGSGKVIESAGELFKLLSSKKPISDNPENLLLDYRTLQKN